LRVAWFENQVLCAALLPCFWLYMDVGTNIKEGSAENNYYQSWIEMYAGEDFGKGVCTMQELCNRLSANSSAQVQDEMLKAFLHAARFEWMFFDAAFRLEQWPNLRAQGREE
jgi:thiaminase/transcriptional activator TenA